MPGGIGSFPVWSYGQATLSYRSVRQLQRGGFYTAATTSQTTLDSSSSQDLAAAGPSRTISRRPGGREYRKVLRLCSRIFVDGTPLRSDVWRGRLKRADSSLKSAEKRSRIAVVGASVSGTRDFLTCLLDEPISDASQMSSQSPEAFYDNHARLSALKARHSYRKDLHRCLHIRYGPVLGTTEDEDLFSIPHTWLKSSKIEFVEIIDPTTTPSTLDELYASDMIIFVTDDLTLAAHHRRPHELALDSTLQLLRYFANKPGTCVLVNHTMTHIFESKEYDRGLENAIGVQAFSKLNQRMHVQDAGSDLLPPDPILHASFHLATRANDALRQAIALPDKSKNSLVGEKASAWANFSSLYSASGLGSVKAATEDVPLRAAFAMTDSSDEFEGATLQTTNYLIRQALDQALYGISAELDEVRQAQGAAQVLRDEVEAHETKTKYQIFSLGREGALSPMHERAGYRSASIDAAAKDSRGYVEEAFARRLPWWRILWKVDDVRAETEAAVDRSFAKDVERQMTFETGKMLNISERLEQRTTLIFKVLNPTSPTSYRPLDSLERDQGTFRSAFQSPILLNELRRHSREKVESKLKADLLTLPIEQRRNQLLAVGGPVDALCVKAQRSVLTTMSIIGLSGMASIAGALAEGPFGAGLPSICSSIAMQPSSAVGLFALSTTFAIWLLQTQWTRAKKRFWRSWERIVDGLDADLRSNLDHIFADIVGAQSIRGAAGLEKLAQKRLAELEKVYQHVEEASSEVREIAERSLAESNCATSS